MKSLPSEIPRAQTPRDNSSKKNIITKKIDDIETIQKIDGVDTSAKKLDGLEINTNIDFSRPATARELSTNRTLLNTPASRFEPLKSSDFDITNSSLPYPNRLNETTSTKNNTVNRELTRINSSNLNLKVINEMVDISL